MKEPTARVDVVAGPWNKPRPSIDDDSREFWDGLREHRLLLWRCGECGAWYWPKAYCREHPVGPYAEGMGWTEASGLGTVFAVNWHHWAFHPGFADEVPYAYAIVELDEGPLISSTLVGDVPYGVPLVGRRCSIAYEDHPDEGFTLPRFTLPSES